MGNRTRERGAVQSVQDVGRVPAFGHGQRSAVQVVLPAHIGPGIGDGRTVRDQRPSRPEQTTVVRHRRADHADQNQRRVDEDFRPSPVPLRSRQRHSAGKTPDNRFTTYSREIPNDRFGTFSRENSSQCRASHIFSKAFHALARARPQTTLFSEILSETCQQFYCFETALQYFGHFPTKMI